jgi:hypothetical protein
VGERTTCSAFGASVARSVPVVVGAEGHSSQRTARREPEKGSLRDATVSIERGSKDSEYGVVVLTVDRVGRLSLGKTSAGPADEIAARVRAAIAAGRPIDEAMWPVEPGPGSRLRTRSATAREAPRRQMREIARPCRGTTHAPRPAMRRSLLLGMLAPLLVALAACSSDDPGELARGDEDGVPESADAPTEPLPDLGPAAEDPGAADAGATDAGTKTTSDAGTTTHPPATTCSLTKPPHAAYLKYGLHPDASDALVYLKVTAGRVTQTIGSAAASAGTHAQDGTAGGHPYSAATDLSVLGLTDAQVAVFLDRLTEVGFVPFYRKPGYDGWPSSEARHIHAIWVGAHMKLSLRNQVRDWHVGKNGLVSHTTYKFKTWSACWRDAIWKRYLVSNPATN